MTTTITTTNSSPSWRLQNIGYSGLFMIVSFLMPLILCPHSKVEESFNLQATHDLYHFGISPSLLSATTNPQQQEQQLPYDHLQYPGVVPRTFAGPLVLTTSCRVMGLVLFPFGIQLSDMVVQFLARFLLLVAMLHAWFRLKRAVQVKFGSSAAQFLCIVTGCQFHLPFYASRMLPNTFALVWVLHAYADWLSEKPNLATVWLVVATVVFRCDVLLLLIPVGIMLLITRQLTFGKALKIGFGTVLMSLLITVPTDTLLWQRFVWPEGEVFWFNAILGKSSDWGTSPWHWYLTNAIPKAMLLSLLLVPLGITRIPEMLFGGTQQPKQPLLDTTVAMYFLPVIVFIGLYSFLGHKEVRFIFPALPMLNVVAAVGLQRLYRVAYPQKEHSTSLLAKLAYVGALCGLAVTYMASLLFLQVSKHNYPGGTALQLLIQHIGESSNNPDNNNKIRVHVDVASAMTGVSLFGQASAAQQTSGVNWEFAKAGYEDQHNVRDYTDFTHLLSETRNVAGFHVVAVAQGNPRLDIRNTKIVTEDAIYVLERN